MDEWLAFAGDALGFALAVGFLIGIGIAAWAWIRGY